MYGSKIRMIALRRLAAKYPIDEIIECCGSNQIRPKVLIRQLRFNPRPLTAQEWGSWDLDRKNFPGFLHHLGYGSKISPIPEKLVELPESIWIELSAMAQSSFFLLFNVAVVDDELRRTWRLPPIMKTVTFNPSINIQLSSLSPLLLSQKSLEILEPHLRPFEQSTSRAPKSEQSQVRPNSRKPHSIFIEQQIRNGNKKWKRGWAEFLKLADGTWRDFAGFYCKLTLHTRTLGKESVKLESDCGQEYLLKPDSFRMVFTRQLKKSEH